VRGSSYECLSVCPDGHNEPVDTGGCDRDVLWSVHDAASPLSTLAGVLAGFLVVVAATAVFAPWDRYRQRSLALFAAGVPALATSSFVLALLSGTRIPTLNLKQLDPQRVLSSLDHHQHLCDKMWGQWLVAMGLLAVGGAVLVCGFAWLLVGYTENAVRTRLSQALCVREDYPNWFDNEYRYIGNDRNIIINAAGWISFAGIFTATVIVLVLNLLYVKATDLALWRLHWAPLRFQWLNSHRLLGNYYLTFLIWGAGLHVLVRVVFLVYFRTLGAAEANSKAHAAAEKVLYLDTPSRQKKVRVRLRKRVYKLVGSMVRWFLRATEPMTRGSPRWRRRFCHFAHYFTGFLITSMWQMPTFLLTVWAALGLAGRTIDKVQCWNLYSGHPQDHGVINCPQLSMTYIAILAHFAVLFVFLKCCQAAWELHVSRKKQSFKRQLRTDGLFRKSEKPLEPVRRIQADFHYRHGRPFVVTGHVVVLAIFGIALIGVLSQDDPVLSGLRLGPTLALLVGGLYPFLILRGLAEAVASGGDGPKVPVWKEKLWILP
jgi:hypothetical protein